MTPIKSIRVLIYKYTIKYEFQTFFRKWILLKIVYMIP